MSIETQSKQNMTEYCYTIEKCNIINLIKQNNFNEFKSRLELVTDEKNGISGEDKWYLAEILSRTAIQFRRNEVLVYLLDKFCDIFSEFASVSFDQSLYQLAITLENKTALDILVQKNAATSLDCLVFMLSAYDNIELFEKMLKLCYLREKDLLFSSTQIFKKQNVYSFLKSEQGILLLNQAIQRYENYQEEEIGEGDEEEETDEGDDEEETGEGDDEEETGEGDDEEETGEGDDEEETGEGDDEEETGEGDDEEETGEGDDEEENNLYKSIKPQLKSHIIFSICREIDVIKEKLVNKIKKL